MWSLGEIVLGVRLFLVILKTLITHSCILKSSEKMVRRSVGTVSRISCDLSTLKLVNTVLREL
jgi:hypothetical protein